MDTAGEGRRWPALGEVLSLATLGVRTHAGVASAPASPNTRAETMRVMALLSVLLLAVNGTGAVFVAAATSGHTMDGSNTFWHTALLACAGAGWIIVYAALVAGMRRSGRALAVALCLIMAIGCVIHGFLFGMIPVLLGTVAVLLAFGAGASPVRHQLRWIAALVPMAGMAVFLNIDFVVSNDTRRLINSYEGAVLGAFVLALAVPVCVQAWKSPVWPVATAVAFLGYMAPQVLWQLTSPWYSFGGVGPRTATYGAVLMGPVLLAALSIARRRLASRGQTT
ncbi:hypothetical protein [Catenulispora rubra]|uniref:hypothetical protein n=1 Tax=Catenulispora rubra TaxID=280293 RepID=UPI0018920718|nr:hypothetical protein [Catenulispora rubra]